MRILRKQVYIALFLMGCLLLCACGSNVRVNQEKYPVDSTRLSLVLEEGQTALLEDFPQLQYADLSGSSCYEEILAWARAHPSVHVRYTVALPDGSAPANDTQILDLSAMDEEALSGALPLLQYLPELKQVDLGSSEQRSLAPATLLRYTETLPGVDVRYAFRFQGRTISLWDTELDLSQAEDVSVLIPWMSCMPQLQHVNLGEGDGEASRIPWEDILAMEQAAPQARFDYSFLLYGKSFSLQDESMNLHHIPIEDQGALVKAVTACMPQLNYLDMDSCGVDDEHMDQLRQALPNAEVVWRIWFGRSYTARTNVTKILASNPDRGGDLTRENTQSLKYCTKVKYLDLGHNRKLDDNSFIACMPELEVAVLAMNRWRDTKVFLNCPNLEYLEIQTGAVSDLRPLGQLKKLKHLNICYDLALQDISPLYDLELDRLWIGCLTPVPAQQVEEYHHRHPNCIINTTAQDPTTEGWRYWGYNEFGMSIIDPRYELLRDQFEYTEEQTTYSYISNDPLYNAYGWPD